jgi:hypothetical protein
MDIFYVLCYRFRFFRVVVCVKCYFVFYHFILSPYHYMLVIL